jgi:hypothetical protein
VSGATVLHQTPDSPRSSQDIDLFHDEQASVQKAFAADVTTLEQNGFVVEPVGQSHDSFRRALVRRGNQQTRIEWVYDSAFCFFPVEGDADMGWRLNFWDATTNKTRALVGRQVIRDYLDCLYVQEHHLHIGALARAAAAKDPGLSAGMIIDWAGRGNRFRPEDLAEVLLEKPVDLREAKQKWLVVLNEARDGIARVPPADAGCLYLDAQGKPICPSPDSPDSRATSAVSEAHGRALWRTDMQKPRRGTQHRRHTLV